MEEKYQQRIQKLESELKSTKYLIIFFILMFIILAYQYIVQQQRDQLSVNTLRTRELIISDKSGREMILMGYPVAESNSRINQKSINGLIILDKNGNDRVVVGNQDSINSANLSLFYPSKKAIELSAKPGSSIIHIMSDSTVYPPQQIIIINESEDTQQIDYSKGDEKGKNLILLKMKESLLPEIKIKSTEDELPNSNE